MKQLFLWKHFRSMAARPFSSSRRNPDGESVGGASLTTALSRLAARGLVVLFGQAGRVPPTIDFFSFFDRHQSATIRHFDYTDSDVPDGVDLATLVRLTHTGRLHPEIGSVSAWENAASLIADLRARRIRGKAILQLDPRNN